MIWRVVLLLLGAALLLMASVAIVTGALRGTPPPPVSTNATVPALTATPRATTAPASATARGAAPTRPAPTPASATRTVANGPCVMGLPLGYEADPAQAGYFPALDRTGFVALDSFAGADQTPATLAQTFASVILSRVLTDYQQTGATDLGDRYRIDYRATSGGQAGRGSTQVQVFGSIGCGVTVFALDAAVGPLATTFDLLVRTLVPVQVPRTGTATATP